MLLVRDEIRGVVVRIFDSVNKNKKSKLIPVEWMGENPTYPPNSHTDFSSGYERLIFFYETKRVNDLIKSKEFYYTKKKIQVNSEYVYIYDERNNPF